jgi:F420-0:gamma-glutamyl ligase-like protein
MMRQTKRALAGMDFNNVPGMKPPKMPKSPKK